MKPYAPSNSTEGMQFEAEFCDKCWHDRIFREKQIGGCEIIARAMVFDVDHENYPTEWIQKLSGPECTAFLSIKEGQRRKDREEVIAKRKRQEEAGQMRLF
jgi:hypothetical protein